MILKTIMIIFYIIFKFVFSGQIKDIECHDCRYKASNFQELKSHYLQQHHKSWTHDTEEILTTKPKSLLEGMQSRNDMNNKSLMR